MRRAARTLCAMLGLAAAVACAPGAWAKAPPRRAAHGRLAMPSATRAAVPPPAPVVFRRATPAASVELRMPMALAAWPAFRAELYKADVAKLNGFLRQAAAAQAAAERPREALKAEATDKEAAAKPSAPTDADAETDKAAPTTGDAPEPTAKPVPKPDAEVKDADVDQAQAPPPPFHRHARTVRYTVAGVTRRLVSVIRRDERDTGGAHPSADISGVIWDQRDHRRVMLQDLIRPDANVGPLDRALCRAVKAAKAARFGAVPLDGRTWRCPPWRQADAALAPSARPGAAGGLIVLIGPAEIGPYVEGDYRVLVALADLRRALRPIYAAEFSGAPGPETLALTGAPQPPRPARARPARPRHPRALH